jgi:DNA-binding FadR family transcriptional regulator
MPVVLELAYAEYHRRLANAVRQGDADLARRFAQTHMAHNEKRDFASGPASARHRASPR